MNVKFVSVPLSDVAEDFAKEFNSTIAGVNLKYNRFFIDGSKMVFVLEEEKEDESE